MSYPSKRNQQHCLNDVGVDRPSFKSPLVYASSTASTTFVADAIALVKLSASPPSGASTSSFKWRSIIVLDGLSAH